MSDRVRTRLLRVLWGQHEASSNLSRMIVLLGRERAALALVAVGEGGADTEQSEP